MIIEDEAGFREMLKNALLRRKYSIIEASDGKEARLRFKASIVDLVVTDILMPEEDGLKVIMKLKEIKPDIKIIAISGGGKAGPGNYLNLAKALGADDILFKPFSLNMLINRIEDLLNPEKP
mgnify:FL=1